MASTRLREYDRVEHYEVLNWSSVSGGPPIVVTGVLANPAPGYAIIGVSNPYAYTVGLLEVEVDMTNYTFTNIKYHSIINSGDLNGPAEFHVFAEDNAIVVHIPRIYYNNEVKTRHMRFTYGSTFGSLAANTALINTSISSTDGCVCFISSTQFVVVYTVNISGTVSGLYTLRTRTGTVGSTTLGTEIAHLPYDYDPSITPNTHYGFYEPLALWRPEERNKILYYGGFTTSARSYNVVCEINASGQITSFTEYMRPRDIVEPSETHFNRIYPPLTGRGTMSLNVNGTAYSVEAYGSTFVERPLMDLPANNFIEYGTVLSNTLVEATRQRSDGYSPTLGHWDFSTGDLLDEWYSATYDKPVGSVSTDPFVMLTTLPDEESSTPRLSVAGPAPQRVLPTGVDRSADDPNYGPRATAFVEKVRPMAGVRRIVT
jgi:hypothetical protein